MNQIATYLGQLTSTKFAHGLFMAVGGAVTVALYDSIQNGKLPTTFEEFKPIVIIGLGTGLSYIIKNKFAGTGTPSATN
jgi:hypothetical protein